MAKRLQYYQRACPRDLVNAKQRALDKDVCTKVHQDTIPQLLQTMVVIRAEEGLANFS